MLHDLVLGHREIELELGWKLHRWNQPSQSEKVLCRLLEEHRHQQCHSAVGPDATLLTTGVTAGAALARLSRRQPTALFHLSFLDLGPVTQKVFHDWY